MIVLNVPVPEIKEEWGYYQYLNKCIEFSQEGFCHRNLHCSVTKRLVVYPKCETKYVSHEGREETIYVLNGTGEANLCGVNVPLPEGSCTEIGVGDRHSIRNRGRGNLEIIEIWIPGGKCFLAEEDEIETEQTNIEVV